MSRETNRVDITVDCKSCGQKYDLRPTLNYGEGTDAIRLHRLFQIVPCCGACGSDNIVVGVHNPYRKETPAEYPLVDALKSGMSVVDINKQRGIR